MHLYSIVDPKILLFIFNMENIELIEDKATGQAGVEYLRERYIDYDMSRYYGGLAKDKILEVFNLVKKIRAEKRYGQRRIQQILRNNFDVTISESTIAGWLYQGNIPFLQEKTQFKAKIRPSKKILNKLYLLNKLSASEIAKKFNVSVVTVINWLDQYNIDKRIHKESMNTSLIKEKLRQKKLRHPTKDYSIMTPEKAYILGTLCGDAYINNKRLRLEIRKDIEFIEKFVKCIKKVYGLKFNILYYAPKDTWKMDASCEIISRDLLKYSKFRTRNWCVPNIILNSGDTSIISSFLQAFFDSEGTVSKYIISAGSINKLGLQQIQMLLNKLGIKSQVYNCKRYYSLCITRKVYRKRYYNFVGFTIKRKLTSLEVHLK